MVKIGPIEIGENVPDMVDAVGNVLQSLNRPVYNVTKTVTKTSKKGKTTTKTYTITLTAAEVAAVVVAAAVYKWYKANGSSLVPPGGVAPAVAPLGGLAGMAAANEPAGLLGVSGLIAEQPGGAGIFGLAGIITDMILRGKKAKQDDIGVPLTTTSYGVESGGQGVVWS